MNNQPKSKQSLWDVVKSIACAILGVQSKAKAEQDFTKGSITAYFIGGVIAVICLIGIIATVVGLVTRGH